MFKRISLLFCFLIIFSVSICYAEEAKTLDAEEADLRTANELEEFEDEIFNDYYIYSDSGLLIEYARYKDDSSHYLRTYGGSENNFIIEYTDNNGDRKVDFIDLSCSYPGNYQHFVIERGDNPGAEKLFISADKQLLKMEELAAAEA